MFSTIMFLFHANKQIKGEIHKCKLVQINVCVIMQNMYSAGFQMRENENPDGPNIVDILAIFLSGFIDEFAVLNCKPSINFTDTIMQCY